MTLKVQPVNVQYITQIWPMVEKFMVEAAKCSDDYSADQIKVYLTTGNWLLLVIVDEYNHVHGAITLTFNNEANYRTAFITAIGGKNIVNDKLFSEVQQILKSAGATRIQAYAKDSAARLYEKIGLSKKATLMEIKL